MGGGHVSTAVHWGRNLGHEGRGRKRIGGGKSPNQRTQKEKRGIGGKSEVPNMGIRFGRKKECQGKSGNIYKGLEERYIIKSTGSSNVIRRKILMACV